MDVPKDPDPTRQNPLNWRRLPLWIALLVLTGLGLYWLLQFAADMIAQINHNAGGSFASTLLIASLILYALLIAIPFMPGIEVGVALLMLQGATIAPLVYTATILGLMLAYLIGRFVPVAWLHSALSDLGFQRMCTYLETMESASPEERLASQRATLPPWLAKLTVDYRYITIGILLNVPGTFAIGGGGGILMAAGFSRLFKGWQILLTLMIFTMPVPLFVWTTGLSLF